MPLHYSGVFARYTDASNYFRAVVEPRGLGSEVQVYKRVAGVDTRLALAVVPQTVDVMNSLLLTVDAGGRFAAYWSTPTPGRGYGAPVLQGQDAVLATGATLATGGYGIVDHNTAGGPLTRTFDNFVVWVPPADAVLHASQSVELNTVGMFREDATGTAWGPVSHVTGDLPRLPPSGLEARSVELFVKASRGDFDQLPDTAHR